MSCDIGIIGLAVMGQNLALNLDERGYRVAVYNRTASKTHEFVSRVADSSHIVAEFSISELVKSLAKPKKVMVMVRSGDAIDEMIKVLIPLMRGGVIIDGGNSLYSDTKRRCEQLESLGIHYLGCGISGGEEGARKGPSIMAGGSEAGWKLVGDMLRSISAQANGYPCCEWMGVQGAGHFVKMVHNGIEYGEMQIMAEIHHICRKGLKLDNKQVAQLFREWRHGDLGGFLLDITIDILEAMDESGEPLLDKIRDVARQKGTGKWTIMASLEYETCGSIFSESVYARTLSTMERGIQPTESLHVEVPNWKECLYHAWKCAKIMTYDQGFQLLQKASLANGWQLRCSAIARVWQGGCIIQCRILDPIQKESEKWDNSTMTSLWSSDPFQKALQQGRDAWKRAISMGIENNVPVPVLCCSFAYYAGLNTRKLPTNLIQAQRDYFGAHGYELEQSPGIYVHTNWKKRPGK